MNERIRELWSQAGGHYNSGNQHTWPEYTITDPEKFAELLIRECADVIKKEVSMKYKDGGETEEFMGGHYAGSVLARVKIKEHFGVEE